MKHYAKRLLVIAIALILAVPGKSQSISFTLIKGIYMTVTDGPYIFSIPIDRPERLLTQLESATRKLMYEDKYQTIEITAQSDVKKWYYYDMFKHKAEVDPRPAGDVVIQLRYDPMYSRVYTRVELGRSGPGSEMTQDELIGAIARLKVALSR